MPRVSRFLFFLPLEISLFVFSLGVFSWNFGGVFDVFWVDVGKFF